MPGDGAAQRAVALRPLTQMIIETVRPHPVRVGVDGFSAAGKSTLADELAAMATGQGRPCVGADLDDFKRPRAERPAGPEGFYRGAFDFDAIGKFLLATLRPGGNRPIRLRFFDQQRQAPFRAEVQSHLAASRAGAVGLAGGLGCWWWPVAAEDGLAVGACGAGGSVGQEFEFPAHPVDADVSWVGPGRPAGIAPGGFSRPARRTRRAILTAPGSPRVFPAGLSRWLLPVGVSRGWGSACRGSGSG